MSVFQTLFGIAALTSIVTFGIQAVAPREDPRPPAIVIRHIEIRADGSVFYDRETREGELITWAGVMYDFDGSIHCSGHGQSQYFSDQNPFDTQDIAWMISPDCEPEVGMTYSFDWFPANMNLRPVHFPEAGGVATVLPPKD